MSRDGPGGAVVRSVAGRGAVREAAHLRPAVVQLGHKRHVVEVRHGRIGHERLFGAVVPDAEHVHGVTTDHTSQSGQVAADEAGRIAAREWRADDRRGGGVVHPVEAVVRRVQVGLEQVDVEVARHARIHGHANQILADVAVVDPTDTIVVDEIALLGLARVDVGLAVVAVRAVGHVVDRRSAGQTRGRRVAEVVEIGILVPGELDAFVDAALTVVVEAVTDFQPARVDGGHEVVAVPIVLGETVPVVVHVVRVDDDTGVSGLGRLDDDHPGVTRGHDHARIAGRDHVPGIGGVAGLDDDARVSRVLHARVTGVGGGSGREIGLARFTRTVGTRHGRVLTPGIRVRVRIAVGVGIRIRVGRAGVFGLAIETVTVLIDAVAGQIAGPGVYPGIGVVAVGGRAEPIAVRVVQVDLAAHLVDEIDRAAVAGRKAEERQRERRLEVHHAASRVLR